jgi:hypothetical protein
MFDAIEHAPVCVSSGAGMKSQISDRRRENIWMSLQTAWM